ncbi:alpha/beta fold hydrolase [Roseovarius sp. EL26]|uniref:alpha/beta fold hydrolase n=1 Tax=Roseovarius sp. EL26 TaxID=2126672 RepID=UPI000EA3D95D|nr:alpha/beta fold hydrolase [Roseovarius sp. EL26]
MPDLFETPDGSLSYSETGPKDAPALILAHPLGFDQQVWDGIRPLLPEGLRVIAYDCRGHGASDCPAPPYSMGALVRDAEGLLDHLEIRDCVFLGSGVGGLVAQGLAVKRLELIRALVLCGTAAKIGLPAHWQVRIDQVEEDGIDAIATAVLTRSFSRKFMASCDLQHWHQTLLGQNPQGYIGCAQAISGTDFYTPTSGLRLPTLGMVGSDDRITPPDLMRETVDLVPGSQFHLIRGSGHLPYVEQPAECANIVTGFLDSVGHI